MIKKETYSDDNGFEIEGQLCVFQCSRTYKESIYEGLYGVSGAELATSKQIQKVKTINVLGYVNYDKNEIESINGERTKLGKEGYKIDQVKIVDIKKIIDEYLTP